MLWMKGVRDVVAFLLEPCGEGCSPLKWFVRHEQ